MSLGQNISSLRRKSGWKKSELAKKCEVSKEKVCKWEKDKREPSVGELMKLAILFDVTVDELIQNNEIIFKKREELFKPICKYSFWAIDGLYNKYIEEDWSRECDAITAVQIIYDILSNRFLSSDGNVYDEYLVENSNEDERYNWVKFINGEHIQEKEGPFKDYIDGTCEINECFEKLDKEFDDKKEIALSRPKKRRENEMVQIYRNIQNVVQIMKNHDKYSDQFLNRYKTELDNIIAKLEPKSFLEKILLLYCNEIEGAWDNKDFDKICKLSEESTALRNYVWNRIPE